MARGKKGSDAAGETAVASQAVKAAKEIKAGLDKPKKKRAKALSAHQIKKAAERAENMKAALDFRKQGYTYAEIAEELGCAISTAAEWVKEAIQSIPKEAAEDVRTMMIERLDKLLSGIFGDFVASPDPSYVGPILAIEERRMRLLGLDKQASDHDDAMRDMGDKFLAAVAADRPVLRPDGAIPANPIL